MKLKTKQLTMCALFAALSAVLSQISLPIGPVPINLVHVSIFVVASLLGPKYATLSQFIFILMGAIGIPVFSGFSGGLGVIFGPTGGFIMGYMVCAFVTGFLIDRFGSASKRSSLAMFLGLVVSYILGTSWFMFIMNTTILTAISICVLPFLFGDVFKVVFSTFLIKRVKPHFS